jgi:hypothetical protein
MTTYFFSYARADAREALRFADDLIAAGVTVWVDQHDIRPSEHWDRAVESAVRACSGMIVILSPRSAASANVADEVSVAIQSGKTLIPIMIERCVLPLRMTRMQYIDATGDYSEALRSCLAAIGKMPVAPGAPRTAPPPSVSEAEAERLARALTHHLGPIAPHLVKRERARAADHAALVAALAAIIVDETDRAAFVREASR